MHKNSTHNFQKVIKKTLTSESIFLNSESSSSTSKYNSVDVMDMMPRATIPGAINFTLVLIFAGPTWMAKEKIINWKWRTLEGGVLKTVGFVVFEQNNISTEEWRHYRASTENIAFVNNAYVYFRISVSQFVLRTLWFLTITINDHDQLFQV